MLNQLKLKVKDVLLIGKDPQYIDIEVGNLCNYNCSVCTTGSKRINREKCFLSKEKFIDILSILKSEKVKSNIRINCIGEPFLNKDIYDIIDILVSENNYYKEKILINTNASLIDIERLSKYCDKLQLHISLDSIKEDAYLAYRNTTSENFLRSIENIKELSKISKYWIKLFTIVTKFNEDHLEDIKKFASDLGVQLFFTDFHCSPFGVKQNMLPEGVSEKANNVVRRFITPEDYDAYIPRNLKNYDVYKFNEKLGLYETKVEQPITCSYVSKAWICADGTVLSCCLEAYYMTINFGNIFQTRSFKDIWHSEKYTKFRRGLLNTKNSEHGACRICSK